MSEKLVFKGKLDITENEAGYEPASVRISQENGESIYLSIELMNHLNLRDDEENFRYGVKPHDGIPATITVELEDIETDT